MSYCICIHGKEVINHHGVYVGIILPSLHPTLCPYMLDTYNPEKNLQAPPLNGRSRTILPLSVSFISAFPLLSLQKKLLSTHHPPQFTPRIQKIRSKKNTSFPFSFVTEEKAPAKLKILNRNPCPYVQIVILMR